MTNLSPPRGVLRPAIPEAAFQHERQAPCAVLAPFIEHFWYVAWDDSDAEPPVQATLPHPNVHLVIEQGEAKIYGIQSGRFTRVLQGRQRVFGIKFQAGGFYPLLGQPVSAIHNRICALPSALAAGSAMLVAAVREEQAFASLCTLAEQVLIPHLPAPDPAMLQVQAILRDIISQPALRSVDDLQLHCGIHKRTLQRLFQQYVGVSPKWVIQRYRLHEAIARIQAGDSKDWAALALELGYFDQAHFVRAFRVLTGMTPVAYQQSLCQE